MFFSFQFFFVIFIVVYFKKHGQQLKKAPTVDHITLVMAVLEILFLGQTSSGEDVMFRGRKLCDLFGMQESAQPARTCTSVMVCNEPADNATAIACTSVMV